MEWIKRNLFFVIGAVVALLLMVGAGFYTWTGYNHNNQQLEKLNQAYADLKRLTDNPFIARAQQGKPDNIKVAVDQIAQINGFIGKARTRFAAIPPIPASMPVTRDDYASALRLTIDQLQREATNNSVVLRSGYGFSFESQRQRTQFDNLPRLAVQLGEVKAICDILNKARVNSIESIRRERVSTDDEAGPQTDYLPGRSETNELAVLSPYEITFRCFSPELAAVVTGFANSPHGIVVKGINVEPGPAAAVDTSAAQPAQVYYQPQPAVVAPPPQTAGEVFEGRYGGKGSIAPPPVAPRAYTPVAVAPSAPKGLPVMINEKQLKVTLLVNVVKLLPPGKK